MSRRSRNSETAASAHTGSGTSFRRSTGWPSARPRSGTPSGARRRPGRISITRILGPRLLECAGALLRVEGRSAAEILGSPDDMKLRSCATLFASVLPAGSVFDRLLEKFYRCERDSKTLQLLGTSGK